MSSGTVIVGMHLPTCEMILNLASKKSLDVQGYISKDEKVEEWKGKGFQVLDTKFDDKLFQANIELADATLIISSERNLDRNTDSIIEKARLERRQVLTIDVGDTLQATLSKFSFWLEENNIKKIYFKPEKDVEPTERLVALLDKILDLIPN